MLSSILFIVFMANGLAALYAFVRASLAWCYRETVEVSMCLMIGGAYMAISSLAFGAWGRLNNVQDYTNTPVVWSILVALVISVSGMLSLMKNRSHVHQQAYQEVTMLGWSMTVYRDTDVEIVESPYRRPKVVDGDVLLHVPAIPDPFLVTPIRTAAVEVLGVGGYPSMWRVRAGDVPFHLDVDSDEIVIVEAWDQS